MELTKHNPDFRLIETMVYFDGKYVNLVYCVSNNGENEGLEAYYHKTKDYAEHFYRSYRWETNKIPPKYIKYFNRLKQFISKVPNGQKLRISDVELERPLS